MRINGEFIEIESCQKNKGSNIVCGDNLILYKYKKEGRVICVLSDGLGSGIKASVLSTITSSMLVSFSKMHDDIVTAAASILKTLPKDRTRKISYSTFCICDIDCFGNAKVVEYETPSFYLHRNGKFLDIPKTVIPVERDDLQNTVLNISEFTMKKEDRLIFFSDGVSQSGMGSRTMPFGWENSREYIADIIKQSPYISARDLSYKIVRKAEENDSFILKDDTSCCVVYMRNPRNLLICTGPPYDEKNDAKLGNIIKEFSGKKVICGGTTARIVSNETGNQISLGIDNLSKDLPPVSYMDGIDLITEGILTLSRVQSILAGEEKFSKNKESAADMLLKLLNDSDKITFLVGTRINIAHQDPTLPVELEIRRNVVKKIKRLLEEKWLKDVDIIYI